MTLSRHMEILLQKQEQIEAMKAVLHQMMLHHRAQLPSEAREMLPHGCGCPLCEQARAALGLKEEQEHV